MTDIDEILNEREKTHGLFCEVAYTAQMLKHYCANKDLPNTQAQAMDAINDKQARIKNGDNNHIDHWRDIAGYAMLVVGELEKEEKVNSITYEEFDSKCKELHEKNTFDFFNIAHDLALRTKIPTDQCEKDDDNEKDEEKNEPKKYELRKYYVCGDHHYESISVDKEVFIHTLNNYSNSKGNKHTLNEDEEHGPYFLCLWMYEKYCPDHIKEKYKINIIYENKYNEDEKENDDDADEDEGENPILDRLIKGMMDAMYKKGVQDGEKINGETK